MGNFLLNLRGEKKSSIPPGAILFIIILHIRSDPQMTVIDSKS